MTLDMNNRYNILKKFVLNRDAASIQVAIESECQMDVLNHLDSDRFSLLYLSAKNNFVAVAKVLLRANADANLRCASQFTALTIAALNGHDQMVKLLLELPEIAIDERDRFQRAALDNAAMMGHAGIAQQLLDANADVVAEQCLPTGGAPVDAPRTALFYAAGNGHTAIVEQLLNANASLDHSLAFAASCGRCETIAFLLQRNADIHQVDASGGSCLHTAAQAAQNDAIALLLQAGAEIDLGDKRGGTPLMRAVCKDRLATVELLLAAGANVNHRNAKQQTPLHEALARGLADIVEQLLKAGADPNAACVHGFTCLHYAVRHQWDTNVVASLLTAKADLDVAASNDMTPLTYAVFCGRASVVKHLLASGARVQNKAMQLARKANSAEIRELFACALCGWGGMCCGECRTNHCQRKCQKLLLDCSVFDCTQCRKVAHQAVLEWTLAMSSLQLPPYVLEVIFNALQLNCNAKDYQQRTANAFLWIPSGAEKALNSNYIHLIVEERSHQENIQMFISVQKAVLGKMKI